MFKNNPDKLVISQLNSVFDCFCNLQGVEEKLLSNAPSVNAINVPSIKNNKLCLTLTGESKLSREITNIQLWASRRNTNQELFLEITPSLKRTEKTLGPHIVLVPSDYNTPFLGHIQTNRIVLRVFQIRGKTNISSQ